LFEPIFFGDVATAGASLTGVMRGDGQQDAAVPSYFVLQLPPELAPALIEDRAIESSLLLDPFAMLFAIAFGRPGHIADLQILMRFATVDIAFS
jgi:hypothetical protein